MASTMFNKHHFLSLSMGNQCNLQYFHIVLFPFYKTNIKLNRFHHFSLGVSTKKSLWSRKCESGVPAWRKGFRRLVQNTRCLTFSTTEEMRIKTSLTFHFTRVRSPKIKKVIITISASVDTGKREHLFNCWLESKLVKPLCKPVQRFLRKTEINISHNPAAQLFGTCPKCSIFE